MIKIFKTLVPAWLATSRLASELLDSDIREGRAFSISKLWLPIGGWCPAPTTRSKGTLVLIPRFLWEPENLEKTFNH